MNCLYASSLTTPVQNLLFLFIVIYCVIICRVATSNITQIFNSHEVSLDASDDGVQNVGVIATSLRMEQQIILVLEHVHTGGSLGMVW